MRRNSKGWKRRYLLGGWETPTIVARLFMLLTSPPETGPPRVRALSQTKEENLSSRARDTAKSRLSPSPSKARRINHGGGMESGDAKMKQLEDENRKLKHVAAELTLDNGR